MSLTRMDKVRLNTDTAFDEEGVPVSITKGVTVGRFWKQEGDMSQVIIWWDQAGVAIPEILGVPRRHVEFIERFRGSP